MISTQQKVQSLCSWGRHALGQGVLATILFARSFAGPAQHSTPDGFDQPPTEASIPLHKSSTQCNNCRQTSNLCLRSRCHFSCLAMEMSAPNHLIYFLQKQQQGLAYISASQEALELISNRGKPYCRRWQDDQHWHLMTYMIRIKSCDATDWQHFKDRADQMFPSQRWSGFGFNLWFWQFTLHLDHDDHWPPTWRGTPVTVVDQWSLPENISDWPSLQRKYHWHLNWVELLDGNDECVQKSLNVLQNPNSKAECVPNGDFPPYKRPHSPLKDVKVVTISAAHWHAVQSCPGKGIFWEESISRKSFKWI